MAKPTLVYLEVGKKKVFACALDWPGWCRAGKDEDSALEALAAYAPRYAVVAEEADVRFPSTVAKAFDVVERVDGNASTDFGVPGAILDRDHDKLTPAQAKRLARLVAASWRVLDRMVAGAPAELRKGPRGGGRDRDKIVEHVVGAESAYARKMGVRAPEDELRKEILAAVEHPGPVGEKGWPVRYAARRIAWHALDHAWEIEDRSEQ